MAAWQSPIYRELNRKLRDAVGQQTADQLAKLGLHTVEDLVRHTPRRYLSGTQMSDFSSLQYGDEVALVAKVAHSNLAFGRQYRVNALLSDGAGELEVTFFTKRKNYAEYWHSVLQPGARGIFVGKVGSYRGQWQLTHPDFVIIDEQGQITAKRVSAAKAAMKAAVTRASLVGLYPATAKLPTWSIAEAIALLLPGVKQLGDTLPDWVVEQAEVLPLPKALSEVHEPISQAAAERGIARLRFDEAFGMQLAMANRRAQLADQDAKPRPRVSGKLLSAFDAQLPFQLTAGQVAVGEQIFEELAQPRPMDRLLQGEVGSGKTVVALRAMLAVVDAQGQAALLAPTEVLAKQHYQSITRLLGDLGIRDQLGAHPEATGVALLTGSRSKAAKKAVLDQVASGSVGIVVGTHALFSDPVSFHDLGLVVVDEQHRFGVAQRAALAQKAHQRPHTLVMTATPIPRSVAMTVFGELAVSELRERPAGDSQVQTVVINPRLQPAWLERAWQRIREEVAAGRQAFVVCPAIVGSQTDGELESASGNLSAVTELLPQLQAGPLAGLRLAMVHGKQPVAERDQAMTDFAAGELDVLVATTVIEVGVDVPNATVMVVMDADRFGISQLHQLRGRIGRGEHSGVCLLVAEVSEDNSVAKDRLQALADSTDGFELAETDLKLRREGDVLGAAQSGASSLKLLRILTDVELIQQAKQLASEVLADTRAATDPLLADLILQAEQLAAGDWLAKT